MQTIDDIEDVFGAFNNGSTTEGSDENSVESNKNEIVNFQDCGNKTISSLDELLFEKVVEYYKIRGKRISDLENTNRINDSDMLLVSRNGKSNAIRFINLYKQLQNDILHIMRIGSMAYKSEYSYALSSHNHDEDFTLTQISSFVSPLSGDRIAKFTVYDPGDVMMSSGASIGLYSHSYTPQNPPEPMIGTLKFVYFNELSDIPKTNQELLESFSFDGWVYPNGEILYDLDKDKFAKALSVFGGCAECGENGIQLPNICGFFRSYPKPDMISSVYSELSTDDSYVWNTSASIDQKVYLKKHNHTIPDIPVSGRMRSKNLRLCNAEGAGTGLIHHGNKKGNLIEHDISVDLKTVSLCISTDYNAGNDEFIPQHVKLPVMIYIGGAYRDVEGTKDYKTVTIYGYDTFSMTKPILNRKKFYKVTQNGIFNSSQTMVSSIEYPDMPDITTYRIKWSDYSLSGKLSSEIIRDLTQDMVISGMYELIDDQDDLTINIYEDIEIVDADYGDELYDIRFVNIDNPFTRTQIELLGLSDDVFLVI